MTTERIIYCPYCGKQNTEPAWGVFLEMGEFDGCNSYQSEGNADGYRCLDCRGEFWIDGPAMPEEEE
jgi:DNA-directed RNA polymerase subunit RPC12/RpoP